MNLQYLLKKWYVYYFSCKTANTSSIVLVCSVCYCYEIFTYKLPINIHVHIRKKHMIGLIMFYNKKNPKNIDSRGSLCEGSKGLKEEKKKANTKTTKPLSTYT